jgi:peptide deformylase
MALIKILQYPDKQLKRKGVKVTDFGDAFQKTVDDMFETHYSAKNCAGFAATQLDIKNAPHVTVIDFSPDHDQPLCLVNAVITHREGTQKEHEGCMSVGVDIGIYVDAKVERAFKIHVKAQDRYGKAIEFDAEEFMAKCIQHELDHLDGKIFLDHLSPLKRSLVEKKLMKELKALKDESISER